MQIDLYKIFEAQQKLDSTLIHTHMYIDDEVYDRRMLALQVELGELANEIASFKYWKKNKSRDKTKILEEYADCMHFFTSLCMYLKVNPTQVKTVVYSKDVNIAFLKLFGVIHNAWEKRSAKLLIKSYGILLGIAQVLEFTNEEIEQAYFRKNQINFERVKNNY